MREQTVLKPRILLTETRPNSISLKLMGKDDSNTIVQISAVFGAFSMFSVERCSDTILFRYLSNHVFYSP